MKIPFINLQLQYESIKKDLDDAVKDALTGFDFCRGKAVYQLEKKFQEVLVVKHCICVGNGTDALFVSLKMLGVGQGDEVIVPAMSWMSSSEVISLCGAMPVFVDIEFSTYTLVFKKLEQAITPKTKAIIVVHLYGQAADLIELKEISKKHNLYLVEDCAQAHLTEENGKCAGTFGDAGAFSFYPTKNLGAYGDAGCIVTNDDQLAEKMRRFTNHGAFIKDDHLIEGMNSRMDTIQAAVLLAKLPSLGKWNEQRIQNAALYNSLLKDVSEVTTPFVRPNTKHTFHIYAIRAKQRDKLKQYLLSVGVDTIIHYPKALPNLPAYNHLNHKPEDFPIASMLQDEILSLPIYPELREDEIRYVCEKIKDFYKK
jgi:dTDP-4-amino-4,6-dideoxygalactose transaminase